MEPRVHSSRRFREIYRRSVSGRKHTRQTAIHLREFVDPTVPRIGGWIDGQADPYLPRNREWESRIDRKIREGGD